MVTQMPSRPGRAQIAVTDDVTVPESVTSSVSCRTSQFVIFCICGALSSRMLADRVQKATCAPSRASSSATAQPSPLLAAATIATRPVSPRSISALHSKLQSSRESRSASIIERSPLHAGQRLAKDFVCVTGSAALRCRQLPACGGIYAAD